MAYVVVRSDISFTSESLFVKSIWTLSYRNNLTNAFNF